MLAVLTAEVSVRVPIVIQYHAFPGYRIVGQIFRSMNIY